MQKESHYRIIGDKLQLSDIRFDEYRRESIDLFSNINSEIYDDRVKKLSDEEKKVLDKLVDKPAFILNFVLSIKEKQILNGLNTRIREWEEKIHNLEIAIENCRHKIQAVRYSFSLIKNEIENPIFPVYERLPMNLSETEYINDVILFEFESFLMQVYSSLDVLIHLLTIFYPCLNNKDEWLIGFKGKDGRAGGKTIKVLHEDKGVKEEQLATFFENVVTLWIQDVHDLRNTVAHQSKVNNLQLFVLDNTNKILHRPQLPDGKDILKYCDEIQEKLLSLFKKVSTDFIF